MLAEAAGRLADGEAEDGGADQAFGPRDLGLGQAAFAQRGLHRGDYLGSREELTPGGGDPLAGVPVALTALATLARPAAWRYFTGSGTGAYSLTPAAWRELRKARGAGRGTQYVRSE